MQPGLCRNAGDGVRGSRSRTGCVHRPETAEAPEEQFLVYEWDTEFSAFLSPPIEVRRMAREDCVKAGYEVAVVETLALEGNVARATYICRGDFE